MIIDVHCPLGRAEYLKDDFREKQSRILGGKTPYGPGENEVAEIIKSQVDRAILVPFNCSQLGIRISKERAAEFVQQHGETFIGFL